MTIERSRAGQTADSIRKYPARFLTILWVIASLALAALGPFGTFERFGFLERLLNWGFAIGMSIVVGLVVNRAAQMLLGPGRRRFHYDLVAVPAMTALYSPALYLHVRLYPLSSIELPFTFIVVNVIAVSLMLIAVREVLGMYIDLHLTVRASDRAAEPPAGVEEGAPDDAEVAPLVARLPDPWRGGVLQSTADNHYYELPTARAASANHYVEVRTDRGAASILLRMSDAVRELDGQPGLQVHRSHWVSDRAVAGILREGHKLLVLLNCGRRVPVSRSQAAAVTLRWGDRAAPPPPRSTISA